MVRTLVEKAKSILDGIGIGFFTDMIILMSIIITFHIQIDGEGKKALVFTVFMDGK